VQRPFERANSPDDGRVDVGEGGGGHTRGKRGRVQFVVGMKDERDIERTGRETARPLPGEHVEEVRRVAQDRVWRNRCATGVGTAHGGHERSPLRRQADGLAIVRLRRMIAGV
jgi:hypothetical protein